MSTAIDPAAAAALEVGGANMRRYFSAVGTVLLYYDWVLTLDDEMRLVWSGALSWPTTLYYTNRYVTIIIMTYSNYQIANFGPPLSRQLCQVWIWVTIAAFIMRIVSGTALLCLRLVTLYRDVPWMKWLLWVVFVLCYGARSVFTIAGGYFFFESVIYSPISGQCLTRGMKGMHAPGTGLVGVLTPMPFDILLLGLTIVKTFKSKTLLESHPSSPIMRAMLRDEFLWFLVIVAARTSLVVTWFSFPRSLLTVADNMEAALESVLISRFFLNLRSIYRHGECRVGSDSVASTVFPVRTYPFWKQANQATAGFSVGLEVEVETSVYGNLANGIGGQVSQAATIDLELAIMSQTRYDVDEHGIKPPADLTPPDDR